MAIDLIKLMAQGNTVKWNSFLTSCLITQNIDRLGRTRRELQMGMNNAVKKRLNSQKVIDLFIRLQRSIEITVKKIVKAKHPNPHDDSLNKTMHSEKFLEMKRKRDAEIEAFYRKSSY